MNETVLRMHDISYSYPALEWKIEIPDLNITRGEFAGIIGPNGAGKSTLLKLASGMIRPKTGKVEICGRTIGNVNRRELARTVGYLPQNTRGGDELTVEHIVSLGRYSYLHGAGFLGEKDVSAISHAMEITSTNALSKRLFGSLSGGERKRVLLASVLAQEPELLLLDEPESSLDLNHKSLIFGILWELAQKGMAVIVSLHDIALAGSFCSTLTAMREGIIISSNSPKELLSGGVLKDLYGDFVGATAIFSGDGFAISYTNRRNGV